MKKVFQIYNSICTKYKSADQLTEKLFSFFSSKPIIDNNIDDFLFKNVKKEIDNDPIFLVQLIGLVHQKKKESNKFAQTDERKHYGIFYTDYEIANVLVKETLNPIKNNQILLEKSFYEPCAGIGIFVLSYLDYILHKFPDISNNRLQKVIDKVYCSDIDSEAISLLKKIIPCYIKIKYNLDINIPEKNYYVGNILFLTNNKIISKNNPMLIFNKKSKFDIVITNPPYKLLKANANKYSDDNNLHITEIKSLVEYIKKNNIYKYNEGTLNYYKIFIEEIIENYTHSNSLVGLLIPNTLLNDLQSEKLRKRIIENYQMSKLYIIPEKNEFFPDITQSFCFFGIDKSKKGSAILINTAVKNKKDFDKEPIELKIDLIKNISQSMPIILESQMGWSILNKVNPINKIKKFSDLLNLRGELDLTLNKKFITEKKTKYPLLKGDNIKEFSFTDPKNYVDEDFITRANGKKSHIENERLACQQISNIHSKKRLKFTKIPKNYILANSCNYICKTASLFCETNITQKYLLGLLNSLFIDWRFKITNSNNHISNYEIGELPIPIPSHQERKIIEELVDRIESNKNQSDIEKLNMAIFNLYNLSKEEMKYVANCYEGIRLEGVIEKEFENVA